MPYASFFETPRLRARPFTYDDPEAFVAYRQHPEVERYQSWSGYTLEQGRSLIASMQGLQPGVPGQWYQIALEERAGGELVGDLALKVDASEPRDAEVGFTLAPTQQGKGYAIEAVRALLVRVGMRREAHFVENVFFKGAWGSEFLFALLEREWSAES